MDRAKVTMEQAMSNFRWKSCTSGANNVNDFLSLLNNCDTSTSRVSPGSDLRVLFITTFAYLVVIKILSLRYREKSASFARSQWFVNLAALHNFFLGFWSLVMNVGATLAIVHVWQTEGANATLCTTIGTESGMPALFQFWMYMFFVSKFYELLDTVILVLRGRPIILLHLWHHASVMYSVWGWLESGVTLAIYGLWFNTLVHTVMYAYYGACLLKIPFPLKKLITSTQIVQFITGFLFVIPFLYLHYTGPGCTGAAGLMFTAAINGSYLILFLRFYKKTYKSASKRSQEVQDSKKSE